jgi:hypothetical protein
MDQSLLGSAFAMESRAMPMPDGTAVNKVHMVRMLDTCPESYSLPSYTSSNRQKC